MSSRHAKSIVRYLDQNEKKNKKQAAQKKEKPWADYLETTSKISSISHTHSPFSPTHQEASAASSCL